MNIDISSRAEEHLRQLLSQQEEDDCGIRIFVEYPGTPNAETNIAYCRSNEVQDGAEAFEYNGFTAWFEGRSMRYLEDAVVDFREDRMGGQLTIEAPNAKIPKFV